MHALAAWAGQIFFILIIFKRGWQWKAWKERFTPHMSEDPGRFELFCFISNCIQRTAQNIYSIYLYTELYQRTIFD